MCHIFSQCSFLNSLRTTCGHLLPLLQGRAHLGLTIHGQLFRVDQPTKPASNYNCLLDVQKVIITKQRMR